LIRRLLGAYKFCGAGMVLRSPLTDLSSPFPSFKMPVKPQAGGGGKKAGKDPVEAAVGDKGAGKGKGGGKGEKAKEAKGKGKK